MTTTTTAPPRDGIIQSARFGDYIWRIEDDLDAVLRFSSFGVTSGEADDVVAVRLDVDGAAFDEVLAQISSGATEGIRHIEVLEEAIGALQIVRDRLAAMYGIPE